MITKEQFQAYEEVRGSGVANMYAVRTVSELSGLTREEIAEIMKDYRHLCDLFPDVRTLEVKP